MPQIPGMSMSLCTASWVARSAIPAGSPALLRFVNNFVRIKAPPPPEFVHEHGAGDGAAACQRPGDTTEAEKARQAVNVNISPIYKSVFFNKFIASFRKKKKNLKPSLAISVIKKILDKIPCKIQ